MINKKTIYTVLLTSILLNAESVSIINPVTKKTNLHFSKEIKKDNNKEIINDFLKSINHNSKLLLYTKHEDILGGVYHFRTESKEFALSYNLKTIFPVVNSLLHKNQQGIFEQRFIPYNLEQESNQSIFKIGKGKKELFAFVNITCPISNNLLSKIFDNENIKKRYTIHLYFFLNKTKNNEDFYRLDSILANHIQNSNNKIKIYKEIIKDPTNPKYNYLNISKEKREAFFNNLENNYKLAKLIGASGTPAIFHNNAKPFYFKKEELEQ